MMKLCNKETMRRRPTFYLLVLQVILYPIYVEMRGLWRHHFCSHQALKSPVISAILARFKRLMGAKRASQKLAFPSILGILCCTSIAFAQPGEQPLPGLFAYYPNTAQHYLELSRRSSSNEQAALFLQAAGRLLQDQEYTQAQRVLAATNQYQLPQNLAQEKMLLSAYLALAQSRYNDAYDYLRYIQAPTRLAKPEQIAFYQLLANTEARLGRYLKSAEARMMLDPLLSGQAQQDNLQRIWNALYELPNQEISQLIRQTNYGQTQGWYELIYIDQQYKANNDAYQYEVKRWQRRFPQHPANALVQKPHEAYAWNNSQQYGGVNYANTTVPDNSRVALLLPLSGKLAKSGEAIRNGFMAAYYDTRGEPNSPESIEVYNTVGEDVQQVYRRALHDGANLVIGPLVKQDVQAIEKMGNLPVPTLVLNYTPSGGKTSRNLYQFALSPQDEARQAAQKAYQDGYRQAVVISPEDDWGRGIAQAFSSNFVSLGGKVTAGLQYNKTTNLDEEVKQMIGIEKSTQRSSEINRILGKKVATIPQRRQDIDVIFLAASPSKARQIRPLLKFYYAADVPIYAISQIYGGAPNKLLDKDLDGIRFCDMPWTLTSNGKIRQAKDQMQELLPNINPQLTRLYAFGFDAYDLSLQLSRQSMSTYTGIPGLTGKLYLGNNHQVFRQLPWAQFQDGIPN